MVEVVLEERQAKVFQRGIDRGDLREDVDAILVLVHHPVNPAHLPLDALEASEIAGLLRKVTVVAVVIVHADILTDQFHG